MKFPKFSSYVCPGDSIEWETNGYTITATIEHDADSHVDDCDCHSPIKKKQWRNDDWFFCGVVLSVSKNGVLLEDHASSLWGIEANYNKRANAYLSTVAKELESEALESAKRAETRILKALGGLPA